MCKNGVKTNFFIDFMKELKELDLENKKYYLFQIMTRVHKTKKFNEYLKENNMNMVYNAPYTPKKIKFFSGAPNKYIIFIFKVIFRNKSN